MQNLPVFQTEHGYEILRIIHEVFDDFDFCEPEDTSADFAMPDIDYTCYFDVEDQKHDHSLNIL